MSLSALFLSFVDYTNLSLLGIFQCVKIVNCQNVLADIETMNWLEAIVMKTVIEDASRSSTLWGRTSLTFFWRRTSSISLRLQSFSNSVFTVPTISYASSCFPASTSVVFFSCLHRALSRKRSNVKWYFGYFCRAHCWGFKARKENVRRTKEKWS